MAHWELTQAHLVRNGIICTAGEPIRLGEYKVLAQEAIKLGFDDDAAYHSARGRVYGILKTAADVEIVGEWSFQYESPQNTCLAFLGSWRSSEFNSSATDRTKQLPFPDCHKIITQDKKIVAYFTADATATVDLTKSKLMMSATRITAAG